MFPYMQVYACLMSMRYTHHSWYQEPCHIWTHDELLCLGVGR